MWEELATGLAVGLRGTQLRPIWLPSRDRPTSDLEEVGEVLAETARTARQEELELRVGEGDLPRCTAVEGAVVAELGDRES